MVLSSHPFSPLRTPRDSRARVPMYHCTRAGAASPCLCSTCTSYNTNNNNNVAWISKLFISSHLEGDEENDVTPIKVHAAIAGTDLQLCQLKIPVLNVHFQQNTQCVPQPEPSLPMCNVHFSCLQAPNEPQSKHTGHGAFSLLTEQRFLYTHF